MRTGAASGCGADDKFLGNQVEVSWVRGGRSGRLCCEGCVVLGDVNIASGSRLESGGDNPARGRGGAKSGVSIASIVHWVKGMVGIHRVS
jgi:hypothetical protein